MGECLETAVLVVSVDISVKDRPLNPDCGADGCLDYFRSTLPEDAKAVSSYTCSWSIYMSP